MTLKTHLRRIARRITHKVESERTILAHRRKGKRQFEIDPLLSALRREGAADYSPAQLAKYLGVK
jgi:hypothetical protein